VRSVAVAAALLLAACGSAAVDSTRPMTLVEASQLAQALATNKTRGGADFRITTLTELGGVEMQWDGTVDWATKAGRASVTSSESPLQITQVWWTPTRFGERRPGLDSLLGPLVAAPEPVIFRPVDLERRLDQVAAVVSLLSSDTPENAQLILQTEGSVFLRADRLRGRDAIVLRYGPRSVYWLDAATGSLVRFEGSDASGRLPIVVDLLALGARTIDLPSSERFVRPERLGSAAQLVTTP